MAPRTHVCEKECKKRWRIGRPRLQKVRLELGLSLAKACAKIGISLPFLNQLELGYMYPRLHVARAISDVYGVPIDQLWPRVPVK